jgi:mannose-6-phosphate isomerase-like protein (cupin superfamily)
MGEIQATAEGYRAEPVRHPPLEVIDVSAEARGVTDAYRNLVLCQVNHHCLRLAVIEGQYPWHSHPASAELFLVLEGTLVIELADDRELRLRPGQAVVVPAGIVHRTRGEGRTVNLCIEELAAATEFVPGPRTQAPEPGAS